MGETVRLRDKVFDQLTAAKGCLTVVDQARLLDVPRSTLYRLRDGQGDMSLVRALRIAQLLGVHVEDLFERVER